MRCCIYVIALLALVSCEPNQNPYFWNRYKNTHLQKKLNVFKPQQNQQVSTKNGTHKIIGGEFVMDIEEFPFMALLLRVFNSDMLQMGCGATILNKKYLLSAAHCFQESDHERYPAKEYTAYAGGLNIERSTDQAKVKQYYIHPQNEQYINDYNIKIFNCDIAVIELDKELHFSSKISSVKLPPQLTTSGLTSRLPKSCILLGTGMSSIHFQKFNLETTLLKVAEVEIVYANNTTDPDCNEITKICNIDVTHNKNTACRGDSGGPLLCDGVQVGIVSYSGPYCIPKDTAVNTRVEYFVDWINKFIKRN